MSRVERKVLPAKLNLGRALKQINELKQVGKVGWLDKAKYPKVSGDNVDLKTSPTSKRRGSSSGGQNVAYIASIMEFGSAERNIPARSPLRRTIAKNKKKWAATSRRNAKLMLNGEISAKELLERTVLQAQGDVKKTISTLTDPPLKESTIKARLRKKKGNLKPGAVRPITIEKPLVDTGLMLATVSGVVEAK